MRLQRPASFVIVSAVVAFSVGCDAVDRARTRFGKATTDTIVTATGSGLALGLQVPPTLRPGDEAVLRLSLNNLADTAVSNVRLELVLPGWAEPMPPRIGERPVSMSALGDGSTLFAYGMEGAALAPKQTMTVEQRIRVPAQGAMKTGAGAWTRVVRARLLSTDGRAIAQVEGQVAVDSAAIAAVRTGTAPDTAIWRNQLGGVQLGMNAAEVKQAAAGARDTTWLQGGARQRALLVPVASGNALAVLSQDEVARIEVTHPSIHTAEGLGVGSTMEQLRNAYGLPCADALAGRAVVWFGKAPGLRFVTNAPAGNAAELRDHPDRIPNTAKVTRWSVSRDVDTCAIDQPRGG
jgi:hypothetical protein